MTSLNSLKVALVYDRINKWGGAERVLLTLHEMFPNAPLYTSVYDVENASWANVFPEVYTSFLQKLHFLRNKHELLGWLMPLVFETFDFSEYDLVISVTSESAKGIVTKPSTLHVCYCLTPTRYLWSHGTEYFKNPLLKVVSKPVVNYLKNWDVQASSRPDVMLGISSEVKKRIKKYYDKNSEVVFPPVHLSTADSKKNERSNYFLIVSRLVPYKKVDLAIKVFNDLGLPLLIIGQGSREKGLRKSALKNIKFMGNVSDSQLVGYYKSARALIMPQREDFGIVGVEAQLLGTPVIAYKKGGSLDIVENGKTGIFFDQQSEASLKQAIANFDKIGFNHRYIRENAKRFGKGKFKRRLQGSLVRAYLLWRRGH